MDIMKLLTGKSSTPARPPVPVKTQAYANSGHDREWAVRQALESSVLKGQPHCMNGYYSWLESPFTGHLLQIDLFYPNITKLGNVALANPASLAIEIQSSLHDGRWGRDKKKFFRNKADFDRYTKHQEFKRNRILAYGIPFLEIDPNKDDLSPANLRKLVGNALGMKL